MLTIFEFHEKIYVFYMLEREILLLLFTFYYYFHGFHLYHKHKSHYSTLEPLASKTQPKKKNLHTYTIGHYNPSVTELLT